MNFDSNPSEETVPPDFVPQSPTDAYQYSPLPRGSENGDSIRLIRLLPGTWDSPIELELATATMEPGKIPYYEAVSYVWGNVDPDLAVSVSCEGYVMKIGRSAAMALRRFRFSDHTRLLWVDAICINQVDAAEKNDQVIKMDRIYQTASQVLVYLGEADHVSDIAMARISERRVVQPGEYDLHIILRFLSQRQWFSRVWVLQEVALADVALVICGAKCVPWACFPAWWARNAALLEGRFEPPPVLSYGPSVMKPLTLLQQLHDTRHSKATLPLDKVYALVGLLQPEDRLGVVVDYTQTTARLYASIAKSIVERTSSLRILSGKLEDSTSPRQEGLPSWVPDWSIATSISSLGLGNKYLEPYDAGGKPACGINIQLPTMSCSGITFDTVKQVATTLLQPGAEQTVDYQSLVTEWVDLAASTSSPLLQSHIASYLIDRFVSGLDNTYPPSVQYSRARSLWITAQGLSTPTIELTPEESEARLNCPGNAESLKFCFGRKLFVTARHGALGLGPIDVREGDVVAVLLGAPVPHILRRQASEENLSTNSYTLVGECFVDGIMAGEALNHLQDELKEMGHRCRTFAKSCSNSPLETFCID
ncbi:heterokaryon incompatibility protein-domain-containing protein [Cercophora samala]|uniref:Heterokaryon incompatibility protein-domain-containing protein n=1 Tax=Cercophora samala TaxID=330535 RepID=A0AA39ZIC2_9PEZI|nr:heterokaryon incompatibility protein-domain-containing protein [Cercophora samala]